MSYLQQAFNTVCKKAEKPAGFWLSLYESIPFYGGPEEGGWWGNDTVLVASQQFGFEAAAEAAKVKVIELAGDLNTQAQRSYGEQCLSECEWLEARGLDDDFLPEPDGPSEFRVQVETVRGDAESNGSRHYE